MEINESNINTYIKGNKLILNHKSVERIDFFPDHLLEIDLNENKLYRLPKLPENLVRLNCGNNFLTEIPDTLKWLYCYNNDITELPILPINLIWLDVSGNRLKNYPTNGIEQWVISHNILTNRKNILRQINENR
jgi:Leucine-rich repeat (LRR) protein